MTGKTKKRGGVVCVGSLNIDLFCYLHDQFPKPGKLCDLPTPRLRVFWCLGFCMSYLLPPAASQQVLLSVSKCGLGALCLLDCVALVGILLVFSNQSHFFMLRYHPSLIP